MSKKDHKTHVSSIWWVGFVQISSMLGQLKSSKPIHLSAKLMLNGVERPWWLFDYCLLALSRTPGLYWVRTQAGIPFLGQRTLSSLWWHQVEGTATSFSDSHDLNYLSSSALLCWRGIFLLYDNTGKIFVVCLKMKFNWKSYIFIC